jgi:hypothetical protein
VQNLLAYIATNLADGFIQQFSAPSAPVVLFAKKKNSGFWLYVDYRTLNRAMVKNQYPLQLISESLDLFR